jgi:hypothetical protein
MFLPYGVYVAKMCLVGFMNCWLWLYVSNPSRNLLTHKISSARIRLGLYRSLIVPIVFIVAFLISFVLPVISRFLPICIPIVLHWGMKGLERKADQRDKDEKAKREHHENHEHHEHHENHENHEHHEGQENHEHHEQG